MEVTFESLGLSDAMLKALEKKGYGWPTTIQAEAIPHFMQWKDVIAKAPTGTGKTFAFGIPMIEHIDAESEAVQGLILAPTRELAIQIGESFQAYGRHLKLRSAVIFGGVGQNPQVEALKQGVDILIATPGRLEDLHQQDQTDAHAADDGKGDHACGEDNACADCPEQERNVQRIFNRSTETNDRQRTDHTEGQNDVGRYGEDDYGSDHRQRDQRSTEACGIHHTTIGFLVNEEDKKTDAEGQHDGQQHIQYADRRYVFQKTGFENIIEIHCLGYSFALFGVI